MLVSHTEPTTSNQSGVCVGGGFPAPEERGKGREGGAEPPTMEQKLRAPPSYYARWGSDVRSLIRPSNHEQTNLFRGSATGTLVPESGARRAQLFGFLEPAPGHSDLTKQDIHQVDHQGSCRTSCFSMPKLRLNDKIVQAALARSGSRSETMARRSSKMQAVGSGEPVQIWGMSLSDSSRSRISRSACLPSKDGLPSDAIGYWSR